jgi:hypothetical protein
MAIIQFTGFECGEDEFTSATPPLVGTVSIQSAIKRSGGYALRVNPAAAGDGFIGIHGLASTGITETSFGDTTMAIRFYFYVATLPTTTTSTIAATNNISIFIQIGTDGKLRLGLNSGATFTSYTATALALSTWYRIDLEYVVSATGSYNLLINGVSELSSGSADLGTSATGNFNLGRTATSGDAIDFYYDDVCIADTNVAIGPGFTVRMDPDGAGYSAWAAQVGTFADADDYSAAVGNDGDTTHIHNGSGGAEALGLALESAASAGVHSGPIRATKAVVVCRDESATVAWRIGTRSSTTNAVLTTLDGGATYVASGSIKNHVRTTAPHNSLAWTKADLDGAQVVCDKTQTQSRALRCTAMALCVECDTTGIENYFPLMPGSGGQKARLRR